MFIYNIYLYYIYWAHVMGFCLKAKALTRKTDNSASGLRLSVN